MSGCLPYQEAVSHMDCVSYSYIHHRSHTAPHQACKDGAGFKKYPMTMLQLSYDSAEVTIDI